MLTDDEKIQRLERAVATETPEEIGCIYEELGEVSFTGRALGAACLYRGLDVVRALVERGASFRYPDENWQSGDLRFSFYNYVNNRLELDYSIMILGKNPRGTHKTFFNCSDKLKILSVSERVGIIDYLCENAEKTGFYPEKLLYFSMIDGAEEFYGALKSHGAQIRKEDRWRFKNACNFGYAMDEKEFMTVFGMIAEELGGEKIRGNMTFYNSIIGNFLTPECFEFILKNFDRTGMNQMKLMKKLVDMEAVSCLAIAEREGWLKYPKKRDELIQYASDNGRAESAAWLLEFKNRTADLAAEREKADKKAERELNAAPDSVTALKQLWSYKKRDDGTLSISKYKGNQTVVNVPEKIGKSIVTNIESGVLACSNVPRISAEQTAIRKKITKIILPKSLRSIGYYAFLKLVSLEEINLPDGLNNITTGAFKDCRSLKSIVIPGSAEKICDGAFMGCVSLKSAVIGEGVRKIEEHAFEGCTALEVIDFPKSVESIENIDKNGTAKEKFPNLTAKVFKGSCAERYCLKNGIKVTYKQ